MSNHVGGSPNAAQHALIDRIAWLRLRIAAMDAKVDPTAVMNAHDTATYLAWSNTLGRLIERLGPAVPVPKKPAKHAPVPLSTRAERQAAMLAKETTR